MAACLNIWLFLYDDVIEAAGWSGDASEEAIKEIQRDAFHYIQYHLGLLDPSVPEPPPASRLMLIMRYSCETLRRDHHEAGRRRFLREIEFYMDSCHREYHDNAQGILPSVEDYWEIRLGTTAVYLGCALAE